MKIKLDDEIGKKYYMKEGTLATEVIDGKEITGKVVTEHPDFDKSLVRNEHYYGQIDYYLEVQD